MCIDHPEFVEATQEFFIRVIEEASQVDNGDILFKSLKSEKGSHIMELLVKVRYKKKSEYVFYHVAEIVYIHIASD